MKKAKEDCFRCSPRDDRPAEVPWDWSEPRPLCLTHKVAVKVEDGQLLDSVLDRAAPADYPLEGGLLAWIFNPVFLEVGADQRIRGWTDFAAGGMAVYEDRFSAKSYFEFRAFETARAVDLLYALRLTAAAGTSMATLPEITSAIAAAETSMRLRHRGPLRGPFEGYRDLVGAWNLQCHLDRVRNSFGHLWPESFIELSNWLESYTKGYDKLGAGTEDSFVRLLSELAMRRFPSMSM